MLGQATAVEMAVRNLGPWPLYQPLLDELDLLSLFDQHLPQAPQQEYSHGQVLQLLLHARLSHPQALVNVERWAEESGAATMIRSPVRSPRVPPRRRTRPCHPLTSVTAISVADA